eukprot:9186506-Pyramimonas_sp.AAC.1
MAQEVRRQARRLKKRGAADSEGIVAEMAKYGGLPLIEAIAALFNDVLAEGAEPPASWKHSRAT